VGHANWHVLLEGAAAGVLVLCGILLMARAPRPWRAGSGAPSGDGADRASQAGRGLAVIAASALLSAGTIHWAAAGEHLGEAALGLGLAGLAVFQVVTGGLFLWQPRRLALPASAAALLGLAGWAWSATLGTQIEAHSALEPSAVGTVALEGIALLAAITTGRSSSPPAAIARHATLLWATAVPVVVIGFLVALLALTHGPHANQLALPTSP
jgi:hypothetical protein